MATKKKKAAATAARRPPSRARALVSAPISGALQTPDTPPPEPNGAPGRTDRKAPPIKFDETQALIERIQSRLDGTFISYWHNPRGVVCHNDVVAIYSLLERLGPQKTGYLFIKSDGGNGQASLRIVSLLRDYFQNVHALIPLECASAATMIALGANSLHMGPMSYLTPVDTSLTHDLSPIDRDNDRVSVSLDELKRVIGLWQKEKDSTASNPYQSLFAYVHPLVIGAVDRADSLSIMICRQILGYHIDDPKKIDHIAEQLNARYPSHSYPILRREARELGITVADMDPEVLKLLLELNSVYSEMGQKCTTDLDPTHSHTDEIVDIIECKGRLLHFELDKDWFYRVEERRWITMNDRSGWRKTEFVDGKPNTEPFHIL